MSAESVDTVELTCELQRVIFQAKDSGFIIGSFIDEEIYGHLTAKGTIINPQVGLEYTLTGAWDNDPKYGRQFDIQTFCVVKPTDTDGIFKYIVRICKFVGNKIGTQIIDKFGENTLDIMKNDPGEIANQISGITMTRALEIQKALKINEDYEKVMVELESILNVPGMLKSLPSQLIEKYEFSAGEIVRKNPYLLTDFSGVAFPLADRVALHIGFSRSAVERKSAAAHYCVKRAMQEGNVWVPRKGLIEMIRELVQVRDLGEGIDAFIEHGIFVESYDIHIAVVPSAMDESYVYHRIIESSMVKRGIYRDEYCTD